jgi:hypothetical protein
MVETTETAAPEIHPVIAAAIDDKTVAKLAPKISKAKVAVAPGKSAAAVSKTSNAVLALFKTLFLPMITPILGGLIVKYGSATLEEILVPARDVLLAAYPLEE